MSAPADEPLAPSLCPQGKHLIAFARDLQTIKVRLVPRDCSRGFRHIPYELLRSVCDQDVRRLSKAGKPLAEIWLPEIHCLDVLDLFVQWLYTGQYTELHGSVVSLDVTDDAPDLKMDFDRKKYKTMDWAVKAAILAWFLGEELGVPRFRNHAMTRLFAALTRPFEMPQLMPALYDFVSGLTRRSALESAVENLVVRNWGDASVVDQDDVQLWIARIHRCKSFQDRFFEESLLSLDQRREEPFVAEEYFET